jgi:hypothetical protein
MIKLSSPRAVNPKSGCFEARMPKLKPMEMLVAIAPSLLKKEKKYQRYK